MSSLIFVRVFSPQHGQRINSPLSVYLLLHGNRKSRQRLDRHGTIELASHTRPTIHLIGGTMNRYGLNVQGSRSTTEVLGHLFFRSNWLQSIQRLLLRKRGGLSSETGCNPPVRYHRCINGFQKIWAIQHLQHLPVRCRSLWSMLRISPTPMSA